MVAAPRSVDQAIARFDEYSARLDGHVPVRRRAGWSRSATSWAQRLSGAAIALVLLAIGTVAAGLVLNGIGLTGLFIVSLLAVVILTGFGVSGWRSMREKPFTDTMANRDVVRTLDSYLSRRRAALPAPAARRADAIAQHLPLLESRLSEVDVLDPVAQDARRLMGKHLPELIERYERVPEAYRQQRDGEGLTVDERLVASLDAANAALGDIGAKLAEADRSAFETQGRFIESRYKDDGVI